MCWRLVGHFLLTCILAGWIYFTQTSRQCKPFLELAKYFLNLLPTSRPIDERVVNKWRNKCCCPTGRQGGQLEGGRGTSEGGTPRQKIQVPWEPQTRPWLSLVGVLHKVGVPPRRLPTDVQTLLWECCPSWPALPGLGECRASCRFPTFFYSGK